MKTKRKHIIFPEADLAWLEEFSTQTVSSVSEHVRRAVAEYRERNEKKQQEQQQKK